MPMTVSPTSPLPQDYSIGAVQTSERTRSTEMGKDTFMALLVASLKYQDPTQPMSTTEMVSQTTQLNTLDKLSELTEVSQQAFLIQVRSAVSQMVGQEVEYMDNGDLKKGVVSAANIASTIPTLTVNGVEVSYGSIGTVRAASES